MLINKKNMVILGLGLGILIFFFGIGVNFLMGPSSEENTLPRQVSAVIKLTGMGMIVISMVIGGFFIKNLDKDIKSLLLIFGIILLIINIFIMSLFPYY